MSQPARRLPLYAALLAIATIWGLSLPLTRIAVSTGHRPLGLIVWQVAILTLCLGAAQVAARRPLPFRARWLGLFAVVALAGTLVPNSLSYRAAAELPAGVMAIVVALVPMWALGIAAAIGSERATLVRGLGVAMGALAVLLLVGPETSLPDPSKAIFVLLPMCASFCYAIEGNYIAFRGTGGLGPVEVLFGASLVALVVAVPAALLTGQWVSPMRPWGAAEWAMLGNCLCHACAYLGYVWLVGRAGAVFAAQVAYLVTATGVIWSLVLLGERYSPFVWAAFALMLAGIALVQPRQPQGEAEAPLPLPVPDPTPLLAGDADGRAPPES